MSSQGKITSGSRKEVKENSHVKTNRVQNSVFLNKTACRSNCSSGALPVVGLSEANPFKVESCGQKTATSCFSIYP